MRKAFIHLAAKRYQYIMDQRAQQGMQQMF